MATPRYGTIVFVFFHCFFFSLKFTGVTVSFDDMSSSATQLSQIALTISEVKIQQKSHS